MCKRGGRCLRGGLTRLLVLQVEVEVCLHLTQEALVAVALVEAVEVDKHLEVA